MHAGRRPKQRVSLATQNTSIIITMTTRDGAVNQRRPRGWGVFGSELGGVGPAFAQTNVGWPACTRLLSCARTMLCPTGTSWTVAPRIPHTLCRYEPSAHPHPGTVWGWAAELHGHQGAPQLGKPQSSCHFVVPESAVLKNFPQAAFRHGKHEQVQTASVSLMNKESVIISATTHTQVWLAYSTSVGSSTLQGATVCMKMNRLFSVVL